MSSPVEELPAVVPEGVVPPPPPPPAVVCPAAPGVVAGSALPPVIPSPRVSRSDWYRLVIQLFTLVWFS